MPAAEHDLIMIMPPLEEADAGSGVVHSDGLSEPTVALAHTGGCLRTPSFEL